MTFILQSADGDLPEVGGKGRALARLARAGLPVPAWFIVSPAAFEASLSKVQRRALTPAKRRQDVLTILAQVQPAEAVRNAVQSALARLCPQGECVAVRSSALDEDSAQHSFAGQLESFLAVAPENVAQRVADVWRSGFNERVLAYREQHGLLLLPRVPAVLVQRLVNAEISGVAFAADPVSGRRSTCIVCALYGLGTALVSGECDADTYHVDRSNRILKREIADKRVAHRLDTEGSGGVRSETVPERRARQPALSDTQILEVAGLARCASRYCGRPQDIEWAIEGGRLYLLQSRPITSLAELPDPDGVLNIWDNSNIAESYGGVTTPLTFSFARRAYEEVYRQFCVLMGVPPTVIHAHSATFRRMLGLIHGRVYYNLLSWYRVLATLPGFTVNRGFMEQMMGVKEGLPEQLLAEIGAATWRDKLKDSLYLTRTLGKLIVNHFRLPTRIGAFYTRLDEALAARVPPLDDMRADELAAYYLDLERQLLTRWDAPLVNDFFAMIFYGVLRRLTQAWCSDRGGTLQNNLLCGEGGIISTEPASRVCEMARLAAPNAELVSLLTKAPVEQILETIARYPEFHEAYQAYLDKFGDRCLEELKLESETLHEDPLPLFRPVGQLASRLHSAHSASTASMATEVRQRAEERVRTTLARRPLRRLVFGWVLRHARARVRDRENLRFERTRLFGHVRRLFVEIGRRFHGLGLLDDPRDVFYLEVNEVLGFIDGTSTTTDLKGIVALRRREFAAHRERETPADRFETVGIVHQGNRFCATNETAPAVEGDRLQGIGCCSGVVRGRVRVITDPRKASLNHGEILVAQRTDPGWVMLFPVAAGLLVERGSVLSHSAIVARELGIPAIVALAGVTRWLKDGDWVELDGASGVVRRLAPVAVTSYAE